MFEFWEEEERVRITHPPIGDINMFRLMAEFRRSWVKNPQKLQWEDFKLSLKSAKKEVAKKTWREKKDMLLGMFGVPQDQIDAVEIQLQKRENGE